MKKIFIIFAFLAQFLSNAQLINPQVSSGGEVSSNFLMGTLSTGQFSNLGFIDHIKYDQIMNQFGSDITLNTSTPYTTTLNVDSIGRITLKAGGTYKMMASALLLTTGSLFSATGWQNADTGVEIGADATQADSSFANTTLTSQPISCAFFSPTIDTRVQLIFKNAVGAVQKSTAGGNNLTWFSIEKIAGNASVTGQSVDYVKVSRVATSQVSVGINTDLLFDTLNSGNIPYNTATGVFALTAGKTYRLNASPNFASYSNFTTAILPFQWVDAVTNTSLVLGSAGFGVSTTNTNNVSLQPNAVAIYTPTTNQTVKVRVQGNSFAGGSGTANMMGEVSYAEITQIGSSAITAVTPVNLARVRATSVTPVAFTGAGADITWTNEEYDTTNSFTPSTGIFTAPRNAYYVINFQLMATSIVGSVGSRYGYVMSKNNSGSGPGNPIISQYMWAATGTNICTGGGETIFLSVGDTFRLKALLNTISAGSVGVNANFDFISISELPLTAQ